MREEFPGWFVTGTDTGVGKTLVACALLRWLQAEGLRAAGCKPVASGALAGPGGIAQEDVERLRAASGVEISAAECCAYPLAEAIAPHAAAAHAGVVLDLAVMARSARALAQRCDAVVVEGAGGLLVPIAADVSGREASHEDLGDLAIELRLPVVLVVGLRLGCINHALLTAEAIARRGLVLAGWVANSVDPGMAAPEASIAAIAARVHAPCLAVLPAMAAASPREREQAALAALREPAAAAALRASFPRTHPAASR